MSSLAAAYETMEDINENRSDLLSIKKERLAKFRVLLDRWIEDLRRAGLPE